MPKQHSHNGILWSIEDGVLAIELAPDGDGSLPMDNVTRTYEHYVAVDGDEVYSEERERVVSYVRPWDEVADEVVEVRVKEGILFIPSHALSGMPHLKRVFLPASLKTIAQEAFSSSSVEKVVVEGDVEAIGYKAFELCSNLTSITMPGKLATIGAFAFHGCTSLESITIPEGVSAIERRTFWGCKNLKRVTLPHSLRTIDECAFFECESLKEIALPEGLTKIGPSAFSSCKSLESITIPEGTVKIGERAFYRCESLCYASIPDSTTDIRQGAFSACNSLTEVILPRHIKDVDEIFGFGFSRGNIKRRGSLFSSLFRRK